MDVASVPSWRNLSSFKTPLRVLAQQFLAGRERWKAKFMGLKQELKTYRMRTRDLSRSRDHWRRKAQELAKALAEERRSIPKQPTAVPSSSPIAIESPPAPSSRSLPRFARN